MRVVGLIPASLTISFFKFGCSTMVVLRTVNAVAAGSSPATRTTLNLVDELSHLFGIGTIINSCNFFIHMSDDCRHHWEGHSSFGGFCDKGYSETVESDDWTFLHVAVKLYCFSRTTIAKMFLHDIGKFPPRRF